MVKPRNSRCKIIPVDRSGLAYVLKLKTPLTIKGFPEDGTIIDMAYDIMTDQFLVLVHSETFEEIELGRIYPYLNLIFEKANHNED